VAVGLDLAAVAVETAGILDLVVGSLGVVSGIVTAAAVGILFVEIDPEGVADLDIYLKLIII